MVNGKQGRRYDAIAVEALAFSPDGAKLAYPALRGGKWTVNVDGEESETWQGLGEVLFSPDSKHLAYIARRGQGWHVVRDGTPGAPHRGVFRHSMAFSADSRHLAYIAAGAVGRSHAVLDGVPGPAFARVTGLLLSASGRLAYVGRERGSARAVVDGKQGPAHDDISELVLAPRGRRVAYLARRLRSWFAVVDGKEGPAQHQVAGLTFSHDGKQLAYAALEDQQARVLLDGEPGQPYDAIRVPTLAFIRSGRLLYVARQGGQDRLVLDGKPGPAYDAIQRLQLQGDRWGYIARKDGRFRVVLDGVVGSQSYPWATGLVLGPGGRHAFLARKEGKVVVMVGARAYQVGVVVAGTLQFSPDGERWACVTGKHGERRLEVVIDGALRRPLKQGELKAARQIFRQVTETTILRRWVAAELARAAR